MVQPMYLALWDCVEPTGQTHGRGRRAFFEFGGSVSISGDTVVVGSTTDYVGVDQDMAQPMFCPFGDTWTQQAKLTASDGAGMIGSEVLSPLR